MSIISLSCKRVLLFITHCPQNSSIQKVQQLANRQDQGNQLPSRANAVYLFDAVPLDGHLTRSNGEWNRREQTPNISDLVSLINIIRGSDTTHYTRLLANASNATLMEVIKTYQH